MENNNHVPLSGSRQPASMVDHLELDHDWELSWYPDPILGKWKQLLVGWTVQGGTLNGENPGKIVAGYEPADRDYRFESRFRLHSADTLFSVIACYLEERNSYYRILLSPGNPLRVDYLLYDRQDGSPLLITGEPVIQAEVDYLLHVVVHGDDVEIFINGESAGSFTNNRMRGSAAGFMVHRGSVSVLHTWICSDDGSEVFFEDDFKEDSLKRVVPVVPEELVTERWIPAIVPGTVQTSLLAAGVIEDPYIGYNGPGQRWIDQQRWIYRRRFTLPPEWAAKNIEINFHGIDYHGYIWLNGDLLGYHEGMHREFACDISSKVRRQGENELLVCLLPCPTPPHSNVKAYILQRWHFNMDIRTVGLWRPVGLVAYNKLRLLDPQIITRSIDGKEAALDVSFTVMSSAELYPEGPGGTVSVYAPGTGEKLVEVPYSTGYFRGAQRQEFHIKVPDVQLWWPTGLGEQPLYSMKIDIWDVSKENRSSTPAGDSAELKFGIRTLQMLPTPEGGRWKYNWVFSINDRPFFGKGVNWMPIDQLLRLDQDHYRSLLVRAKDANINIMRLWGGGLIETDEFYDICDELGICIWQEFPFANSLFHTIDYNVLRDTVIQNVKRLRNHPCLVMWCCGNEFDANNAWNKSVVDTFEHLCREFDPTRDVHRASPYGGDSHSYQVNWEGGANYTYFTRDLSVAITEFSAASPPMLDSLRKVIPEEELTTWPPSGPESFEPFGIPGWNQSFREKESAFSAHDAHLDNVFSKQMSYISDCGIPESWEDFVGYAQATQGMQLRFGLDFWRSRWPYCTLTMGWCFNVIWPSSMTWEVVDWYGVPKSSYYDYKNAYEPIHAGAIFEELFTAPGADFRAKLFVANDTLLSYPDALLSVRLYANDLTVLDESEEPVMVRKDTTFPAGFFTWRVPKTSPDQVLFLRVDLVDAGNGQLLSRSIYTPRVGTPSIRMPYLKNGPWIRDVRNHPADVAIEWSKGWQENEGGWMSEICIRNTGGRPAYYVSLSNPEYDREIRYSDNYFWLEPGESKIVLLRLKSDPPESIFVKGWNIAQQTLDR